MSVPDVPQRWRSRAPLLLVLALFLAYLPAFGAGFLNWDDPWLIRDNPVLADASWSALGRIWFDFDRPTRHALGAEWLPVRDSELWLEARVFGLHPTTLRASALALYAAAVLLLRRALHRCLGDFFFAELATWLFALHPVHAESVAWLSGRKDLLGMLFVAAALALYSGKSRHRIWSVPLCLGLAHLSKSMTVSAVGLLLLPDLLLARRPHGPIFAASGAVLLPALLAHTAVGDIVGMTQAPAGGSLFTQAVSMGPVYLRYVGSLVFPPLLSLVHDVPVRPTVDLAALAGYLLLLGWLLAGLWSWRARRAPLVLASFVAFAVPLLPVSQIPFPLQNQMADRYLYLSALAPALLVGSLLSKLRTPEGGLAAAAVTLGLVTTGERAHVFGSSLRAFADATAKTQLAPSAPYQLAAAYEEVGQTGDALRLYRLAQKRAEGRGEIGRRATNNVAKLEVASGDLEAARRTLLAGRALHPDDPKLLSNLVKVLAKLGRSAEAKAAFDELARRYPVGPPPSAEPGPP